MKQVSILLLAGSALLFQPKELSAQLWDAGVPGEDLASLAVQFGAVSPNTTFSDGSSFKQGVGAGATASLWINRHLGIRTHAFRSSTDGQGGGEFFSPNEAQQPVIWIYGLEAALRMPMGGGTFGWFPYVAGGPVGKSYRWSIDRPTGGNTAFGYTVAGGVELRPLSVNPVGIILEARMLQHKYDFMGLNEDYRDLLFTAGFTLSR